MKNTLQLLERVLNQGFTCHITTASEDMCRTLNTSIWTFSTLAFSPHGSVFDVDLNPKDQPIWLSLDQEIKKARKKSRFNNHIKKNLKTLAGTPAAA